MKISFFIIGFGQNPENELTNKIQKNHLTLNA